MIDLHIHTTYSDGTDSPAQIVEEALRLGLTAIAVTDHETLSGVKPTIAAAEGCGLEVVPGIEISTDCEGHEVHIVGLFVDEDNAALAEEAEKICEGRIGRNFAAVKLLREKGYDISDDDLLAYGSDRVLTKGNVAEILVNKGYADDLRDAIDRFLVRGGIAYSERYKPEPERVIELIHGAGGLAFVAHINQIDRKDLSNGVRITRHIINLGADGLETRYSEYDDETRMAAEGIAKEFGVLRSGGSDYHGTLKKGLFLGTGYGDLQVPGEYLAAIKARHR